MTSRSDTPKFRAGTRAAAKVQSGSKVLRNPKSGASPTAVAASTLTRGARGGRRGLEQSSAPASKTRQKMEGAWLLQDAKARFSELVRRVKTEGPQQVSVHGKVEVVVVSADEFRRLKGEKTGAALITALQASPHLDVDIAPQRAPMPVRTVDL